MRITFVVPTPNLSGGIKAIACFAGGLAARGHEVVVVSQAKNERNFRQKVRGVLRGEFFTGGGTAKSHLDDVGLSHRIIPNSRDVIDGDLPDGDIVIATWWETAPPVARLSPQKGAKVYFVQLDERQVKADDAAWARDVEATWRLSLWKIAISSCVRDALQKKLGPIEVPVVVNGVDMEQFHAPVRKRNQRPVIGFLYATTPRKGFDIISQVVARVRAVMPNVSGIALSAVRPGPGARLPAGTAVVVAPAQKRLKEIYARCDVWLCASRAEGFHLPPMEAMACRCPVVSTRVGGPMDMIESGVNGFLNDVDDVEGLTKSILQVLTVPQAEWQQMSEAAAATAGRFSWEAAVVQYERVLQRIVEQSRNEILQ